MLIGLTGAAGSGKDTFADFLVKNHGFKRIGFADAVRDAALALNPIIHAENDTRGSVYINRLNEYVDAIGWDKAKRELPEVRRILQLIGTEVGRQILGENCWVDIAAKKVKPGGSYVFSDMRFLNEQQFIERQGGLTVKLIRPHNPDAIPATHASEMGMLKCKVEVTNTTLEELEKSAVTIAEEVNHPVLK